MQSVKVHVALEPESRAGTKEFYEFPKVKPIVWYGMRVDVDQAVSSIWAAVRVTIIDEFIKAQTK